MRTAFIEALCEMAEEEPRLWLVCGDLGFSVLERFRDAFPNRYLNAGVAEQNMTGMAAGLAMSGKIVFTYSIANFPVMRCLEQIRNDVCYHNANVKIVAVGGGLAYGAQGYTHHGVEDLAVLRVLPNMLVIAPGDPIETRLAVRALTAYPGPAYLRLGKAGEPVVHTSMPDFIPGKAILLRDGNDATLISAGGMLYTVMQAANKLAEDGVQVRVLSMHTIAPLDEAAVLSAALETGGVITIEEHGAGGLGSAAAEALAMNGMATPFRMLRLPRAAESKAGSQEYLRAKHGLTVEGIQAAVKSLSSRGRDAC